MRIVAALACALLIHVSSAAAQDATAERDPQLAPMDAHYARIAQAYVEEDAGMVLAYRTPDFYVETPSGDQLDYQATMQILLDLFEQSEDIEAWTEVQCASMVSDTEAEFVVIQHLGRTVDLADEPTRLQNATTQTETWRLTPEGWRFASVSNIVRARTWVDGAEGDGFTSPAAANTCTAAPAPAQGANAATE